MTNNKDKLIQLQNQAIDLSLKNKAMSWFVETHIKLVEKNALWLLEKLPQANREVVLAAVWLHDIMRVLDQEMAKDNSGDHAIEGAKFAEKMIDQLEINNPEKDLILEAIRCHSCKKELPQSLEAKIIASADAMAHMYPEFFLGLLKYDQSFEISEMKSFAVKKIEKDLNNKIFFDFAKDHIKDNYNKIKAFFEI